MAKPKTFLDSMEVDVAQKAHNCQHNGRHRIKMGDKRLSVKVGRSFERFCRDCAQETINRDIGLLQETIAELD